jgi:ppGpp synthetase/RelA/SpoT-type nucleotidyltranferase
MPAPRLVIKAFLRDYALSIPRLENAATTAKRLVHDILIDSGVENHQVTSRVKSISSIRSKLRRKNYSKPDRQLTDKIGVRAIMYYESDVNLAEAALRAEFTINQRQSHDKQFMLGLKEFGYRSVHLIAQLKGSRARSPEYTDLQGIWFEIQVRSILEHAWAEIEHEVVYKSGIKYPRSTIRRFAAIAGSLEILDREFSEIRKERRKLIETHKVRYRNKQEFDVEIDAARLLALFEQLRPQGLSWLHAEESNRPFPRRIESKCVDALTAVKVCNGTQLIKALKTVQFRSAAKKFAAHKSIGVQEISHLAAVALIVGSRKPTVLSNYLEEVSDDPSIVAAFKTRTKSG